jgi:hypothetical protein
MVFQDAKADVTQGAMFRKNMTLYGLKRFQIA